MKHEDEIGTPMDDGGQIRLITWDLSPYIKVPYRNFPEGTEAILTK